MEPPTVRKILGHGWTYCPRCEVDSMVTEKGGWHCPWCGITLTLAPSMPTPEFMLWSEALNGDEVMREYNHLQERAQTWVQAHKDDKPPIPPKRVIWFVKLTKPLAKVMGVIIGSVYIKKDKEVTSEQGK